MPKTTRPPPLPHWPDERLVQRDLGPSTARGAIPRPDTRPVVPAGGDTPIRRARRVIRTEWFASFCRRLASCAIGTSPGLPLNDDDERRRQQSRVRLGPPVGVRSLAVSQRVLLLPPAHPRSRGALAGSAPHRRGQLPQRPRQGRQQCARPRPLFPAAPRPRAPRIRRPQGDRLDAVVAHVAARERGPFESRQT